MLKLRMFTQWITAVRLWPPSRGILGLIEIPRLCPPGAEKGFLTATVRGRKGGKLTDASGRARADNPQDSNSRAEQYISLHEVIYDNERSVRAFGDLMTCFVHNILDACGSYALTQRFHLRTGIKAMTAALKAELMKLREPLPSKAIAKGPGGYWSAKRRDKKLRRRRREMEGRVVSAQRFFALLDAHRDVANFVLDIILKPGLLNDAGTATHPWRPQGRGLQQ